jgi:hypothetical protein
MGAGATVVDGAEMGAGRCRRFFCTMLTAAKVAPAAVLTGAECCCSRTIDMSARICSCKLEKDAVSIFSSLSMRASSGAAA